MGAGPEDAVAHDGDLAHSAQRDGLPRRGSRLPVRKSSASNCAWRRRAASRGDSVSAARRRGRRLQRRLSRRHVSERGFPLPSHAIQTTTTTNQDTADRVPATPAVRHAQEEQHRLGSAHRRNGLVTHAWEHQGGRQEATEIRRPIKYTYH